MLRLNVAYQWNKSIGTALGCRILGIDYEGDGYAYAASSRRYIVLN